MGRNTIKKVCLICGEDFNTKWVNQKYCGAKCYRTANYDYTEEKRALRKLRYKTEKKEKESGAVCGGIPILSQIDNVSSEVMGVGVNRHDKDVIRMYDTQDEYFTFKYDKHYIEKAAAKFREITKLF